MRVRRIIKQGMESVPSIIHVIVATVFTLLDPYVAIAATLCYVYYQFIDYINNEKPIENQIDVIEWMLGLLIGAILRLIW